MERQAPSSPPAPNPAPAPTGGAGTEPDYGTCAAAEDAGADTPYSAGTDPEYAYYRDGDGDGSVCE